ncbi:MAG: hypothetical protein R3324_05820, partial [Halobacteriales archaeon]|nr:hypothetical protein [Halobacteriales archaeon]
AASVGSEFGAALAADDDASVLVVGAPGVAQAVVYTWDSAWNLARTLESPNGDGSTFGRAVAVSDDGQWVAVGDPTASMVRVFSLGETAVFHDVLGSDVGAAGRFGFSVAIEDDVLLVGSPAQDAVHGFIGNAEEGFFYAGPIEQPWEGFGSSIALEDRRFAIGATSDELSDSAGWVGTFDD